MFAATEDLAVRNQKILKELSETSDSDQEPNSGILSKILLEKLLSKYFSYCVKMSPGE